MDLLVLGLISFVAWFFSMLAGGGSPFVLIPLVNGLLGVDAVAPTITTGMLVGNIQRIFFFFPHINWTVTVWYLPGAVIGAVLGSYTFTRIHLEWVQVLIGLALVLMALNYWLGKQSVSFEVKAWYFLPISFFYAFGSGLIGSMGPIMNPIYLNYGLEKEQLIATKAINVAAVHVIKMATYLVLGALNPTFLLYGAVIGLASIPANWLGKQVLSQMSNEQFRHVVVTFVAISGVWMLWEQRSVLAGL